MTDDICQENAMEISTEGTVQDILNKVNVKKNKEKSYENWFIRFINKEYDIQIIGAV